ncbi:MAG: transcriptional regulator [Burkholderiaceae bacterium]|nr:transcriptional regulator [Burkholderiaceae bacterium]MCD8517018.1 transcriptional regulator [Burkholderiaceae bacterium]MCD8536935.1 transcriptional regulator [Burkholderiaceae bacterium]
MEIKPIRTKADYKAALTQVSALIDIDPAINTPDGDRLDVLVTLIQAYEAKHFKIDAADPVEAIKFRMEQGGLTIKDLEPMIGRSNRVYEVLNRKRPLTLQMIRKLSSELGIPAQALIWITAIDLPSVNSLVPQCLHWEHHLCYHTLASHTLSKLQLG